MLKRILIADDEKYMVSLLTEALAREDVAVIGVSNGEEAINYVRQNSVDLVITDVAMPKLAGDKLFYELRAIEPFLQIIVITAYPDLRVMVDMLESGVSDFIIKPFKLEKLKEVVAHTLLKIERWKQLRTEWLAYKKRA